MTRDSTISVLCLKLKTAATPAPSVVETKDQQKQVYALLFHEFFGRYYRSIKVHTWEAQNLYQLKFPHQDTKIKLSPIYAVFTIPKIQCYPGIACNYIIKVVA